MGNSGTYGLPCYSMTNCTNAEVNNSTFGDLVQTVNGLIVDDVYALTLAYGSRIDYGHQLLNVKVNGSTLGQGESFGSALDQSLGWSNATFYFVATSTSAVVEFQSVDTSGDPLNADVKNVSKGGNEITNISLTAVPEPATWAMMLAGFAMVGAALRRRSTAVRVSFG